MKWVTIKFSKWNYRAVEDYSHIATRENLSDGRMLKRFGVHFKHLFKRKNIPIKIQMTFWEIPLAIEHSPFELYGIDLGAEMQT